MTGAYAELHSSTISLAWSHCPSELEDSNCETRNLLSTLLVEVSSNKLNERGDLERTLLGSGSCPGSWS